MEFTRSGIRRYFQNTSWLLGGHAFRMGIGLIVTVAVARYLGPGKFGQLNFAMAITLLLGVLANLGLDKRVRKEFVESPERRDTLLGSYVFLTFASSAIVYGLLLFVVGTSSPDPGQLYLYAWLGAVFLVNPLRGTEIWFQSSVQSKFPVIAGITGVALSAAAKLGFIYFGAGVTAFAAAIFLETLVIVIVLIFLYRRFTGSIFRWRIDLGLSLNLLKDSWPLLLSGVAVTVYMQIDQVMLGALLGEEAVGNYSAAIRISTIWYFIPMMLATSLFPAIVKARGESAELYGFRSRQYFQLNALFAYGIMIPLTLGAGWLVPWLYGGGYGEASGILAIHIWSLLFVFLGVARGQILLAEERYRFVMVSTVSGALLNIALNFLLIPRFGGQGAAVATLFSQGTAVVAMCFVYAPVRPLGLSLVKAAIFPFGFIRELLPGR